jgi:2-desacetyl-2-hydroxyethyl bacteriochlorophyllide A dehydrogenase
MKAIVSNPPRFDLEQIPEPNCQPDEVIVRTAFCGICGTDLEILHGTMPDGFTRYPVVPGHEWTGTIEEVGSRVGSLRVGNRVSVEGYLPCGKCVPCREGKKNLCVTHAQIGMTQNGGLAEYVAAPAVSCHLVADHVGLDEALMVEPASTVVRGIDRAHPRAGSKVAVIGCGPIGLIAARVLRHSEPSVVLGIDVAPSQSTIAALAGFTAFTVSQHPSDLIEQSESDGWDLVINCAGGNKPLELAFQIARPGGTIVAIGSSPNSSKLQIPSNVFVTRDLRVHGILGYTTESWIKTLDLVSAGRLPLLDLISHRRSLEEFDSAIELLQSRSEAMGKIAVCYPS